MIEQRRRKSFLRRHESVTADLFVPALFNLISVLVIVFARSYTIGAPFRGDRILRATFHGTFNDASHVYLNARDDCPAVIEDTVRLGRRDACAYICTVVKLVAR